MYRRLSIRLGVFLLLLSICLLGLFAWTSAHASASTPVVTPINNFTSNQRPALLDFHGALYVAFVGTDGNLYMTRSNDGGHTFPARVQINNAGTQPSAPALTSFRDQLYLAWISHGTTNQVNSGIFDTWTQSGQLKNLTTITDPNACVSSGPSMASLERTLYVAWKECDPGLPIGNIQLAASVDGSNFTSTTIDLGTDKMISGPALLAFHNTLYVAWRSIAANNPFTIGTYPGSGNALQNTTQLNIGGLGTINMTQFHDHIWFAWDETMTDYEIASYNGTAQVQDHQTTGIFIGTGPGFTAFEGHLYIAWSDTNETRTGQLSLAKL